MRPARRPPRAPPGARLPAVAAAAAAVPGRRAGPVGIGARGPQPRPQRRRIGVGRVLHPGQPGRAQRRPQPHGRHAQQRAQQAQLVPSRPAPPCRPARPGRCRDSTRISTVSAWSAAWWPSSRCRMPGRRAGRFQRGVARRPRALRQRRPARQPASGSSRAAMPRAGQPRHGQRRLRRRLRPQPVVDDQRQHDRRRAPAPSRRRSSASAMLSAPPETAHGQPRRRLERPERGACSAANSRRGAGQRPGRSAATRPTCAPCADLARAGRRAAFGNSACSLSSVSQAARFSSDRGQRVGQPEQRVRRRGCPCGAVVGSRRRRSRRAE